MSKQRSQATWLAEEDKNMKYSIVWSARDAKEIGLKRLKTIVES